MTQANEKYEKLLKILRESKPILQDTEDIKDKVISRIRQSGKREEETMNAFDYLFGWVYISWVRNSLIAASVILIGMFVYQQAVILNRINTLSNRILINESNLKTSLQDNLREKIFIYKLTGSKIKKDRTMVSEKQIEEFLESVDDLKTRYKDLIRRIEEDPELKKEIEKRMTEKHRKKFNLL